MTEENGKSEPRYCAYMLAIIGFSQKLHPKYIDSAFGHFISIGPLFVFIEMTTEARK